MRENTMEFVYMDNSSTTKPAPEVVEAMVQCLTDGWGNPSSLHGLGSASRSINRSRAAVAGLINAGKDEIYFTSGGTEANNWAILGTLNPARGRLKHVIASKVEHPSVLATLEYLSKRGCEVTLVPVDRYGFVDPDKVMEAIKPETALISLMMVQNEIGTIEPCKEIGKMLRERGDNDKIRFHVDAVQGFARLPIDVKNWGVDLLTMSAHKIHGPKGVGAIYIRKGVSLAPLLYGGEQESGMRSGTENVPGVTGMGEACRLWSTDREAVIESLQDFRERLIRGIREVFPQAVLHGPEKENVAPYIIHFSFPGYRGETMLNALEQRGVYVSTGSACSSRKAKPSPVVLALGGSRREALSAIRFSMSRYTTQEDIDKTIEAVRDSIKSLLPWREKN